ncbi:MAG: 4Fe-4S ferredoxin [Spirochaetae bacterium HGW-Spirochaetae-1]|jgi:polyferredoxin|nr:MAG: 4Fe-4S ferredoxin [Spirochaetae bacterium HGW-Spirochaetae-1]
MIDYRHIKTVVYAALLIALIAGLSLLSVYIRGARPEKIPLPGDLVISGEMTVEQFGRANDLPDPALKEIFNLESRQDLEKKISDFGTTEAVSLLVGKKLALAAEGKSKNWYKIAIKFVLWFIFLAFVFFFLRKRRVSSGLRKGLLFLSLLVFGVILGSDPGPMGTVKDAIHLYGSSKAIFPPRMIALTVFLLMVLLANKFICAWGCQAGTLQDLIFRINENETHKSIAWKQVKLPFVLTNSIRIIFFMAFTAVSFLWGTDIIDPIDIFKVYNPAHLGIFGTVFIGMLLSASLFVYRPWCHLLCPFGLAGWIVEKASLVKISVDYTTCIACKKCSAACPSTVMSAILLNDKKTIPDCFACYTCRDVCPTGSIEFSVRKRSVPPPDHFGESR